MPYCLSCQNHFETIPEMEWIDCNRMGLCKSCAHVDKVRTIMVTGRDEGYIASNIKHYAETRQGINIIQNYRDLFDTDIFCECPIDAVIHLAAISGVKECETLPETAINTNVLGTLRVIRACEKRGIPVWLASSFAAIQPENLYGHTKLMAEYIATRYELGFVFVISNVYGGINFDRKTSILAQWMKCLQKGVPILIHGDGEQERDFIHVTDVARAMIDQMQVQLQGGPSYKKYYLCSGVKTSVNQLYTLFEDVFEVTEPHIFRPDMSVGITTPYVMAPMPHCTPRIGLRDGIHQLKGGKRLW